MVINPYRQEHADLLEAIWNDKPYNEGWFGATSSFTAVLGRAASYCGHVVKWDKLAEKGASGSGTVPLRPSPKRGSRRRVFWRA